MIEIRATPDMNIEPGHQWLVLPDTNEGRALMQLLSGVVIIENNGTLLIPHNATVDANIVALIDQLAHARYQAPGLIQMTLQETPE